jgi:hypothetical protein
MVLILLNLFCDLNEENVITHMRRVVLLAVILLCGCIRQSDTDFDYDSVYIGYTVVGGPVPYDQHTTEHVIDNTEISYTRKYVNGTISYQKNGKITPEEYQKVGREIAETGVYGMLDEYTPSSGVYSRNNPTATLRVNIDGNNKTILMKPFVEDYVPGNIQKIIFAVRHVTQELQP